MVCAMNSKLVAVKIFRLVITMPMPPNRALVSMPIPFWIAMDSV